MIEEPYRWVEAIANRREYIETQLASGNPILALSFTEGILLATLGRARQKIFEIYDRIALGAIGHPGDIERLRMAAIEVASTEGFTRSAGDVSLRRLAHYSLSPVLKNAFEQVYGAPYLARLLFAEIGASPEDDLFLRLDFDGVIATNAAATSGKREWFAVLTGTSDSAERMEARLRETNSPSNIAAAVTLAFEVLTLGRSAQSEAQLSPDLLDAALLEREVAHAVRYRALEHKELEGWLAQPA